MKPGPACRALLLAVLAVALGGCAARTWEDRYTVKEAVPAVGTHHRRSFKYGEEVPPPVSPRIKVQGEGLRLLLDEIRAGGG